MKLHGIGPGLISCYFVEYAEHATKLDDRKGGLTSTYYCDLLYLTLLHFGISKESTML